MTMRWYVVHAYSGFEKSVARTLEDRIRRSGMEDKFGKILVPTEEVAQVVAQIGGPPEYVEKNWDRLVGTAHHLAELKVTTG